MNKPLIIGLTGGIGSGKTTVSKIFKGFGIPIFNSDVVAKEIINLDVDVIKVIKKEFGNVYLNGVIDTKKMRNIVFNDKKALKILNEIVHPKVKLTFYNWVNKHKDYKLLIKEAAILIEIGAHKEMDSIILVKAPKELRINRLLVRDNMDRESILKRMNAQLADKEKIKFADYVINNNDKELVVPQVEKIYNKLLITS